MPFACSLLPSHSAGRVRRHHRPPEHERVPDDPRREHREREGDDGKPRADAQPALPDQHEEGAHERGEEGRAVPRREPRDHAGSGEPPPLPGDSRQRERHGSEEEQHVQAQRMHEARVVVQEERVHRDEQAGQERGLPPRVDPAGDERGKRGAPGTAAPGQGPDPPLAERQRERQQQREERLLPRAVRRTVLLEDVASAGT